MTRTPRVIRLRPRPAPEPSADDLAIPVWLPGDPCHALGWAADLAGWDAARLAMHAAEVERLTGLPAPWNSDAAGYLAFLKVKGAKTR